MPLRNIVASTRIDVANLAELKAFIDGIEPDQLAKILLFNRYGSPWSFNYQREHRADGVCVTALRSLT